MLQAALGSIIRGLLAGAAGYLVSKGVWSSDAAKIYVEAATLGSLSLGWSIYQKWKSHQLIEWLQDLASRTGWHPIHGSVVQPPSSPQQSLDAGFRG